MRVFWIIVGIVALIWLGFLHFDRNEIRLDLDNVNKRIDGIEQNGNFNNVDGNEFGDEMQDVGEEINEGIQPNKGDRLRDDIIDKREELKEERNEKKEQLKEQNDIPKDVPAKDVPAKDGRVSMAMANEKAINAFLQQPQPKMVDYEQKAIEAYVQDGYTATTIAYLPIEDKVVLQ